jgi:hypothetical protein
MFTTQDILMMVGAVIVAITLVLVMKARKQSHGTFMHDFAKTEVCDHLRPALELLLQRGHTVRRAGQRNPEMPLEIHIQPPFDPQALYDELNLAPPVHLSERNVLFCKEDWCELHPAPPA